MILFSARIIQIKFVYHLPSGPAWQLVTGLYHQQLASHPASFRAWKVGRALTLPSLVETIVSHPPWASLPPCLSQPLPTPFPMDGYSLEDTRSYHYRYVDSTHTKITFFGRFLFFNLIFILYWSIVDLQCCVSFRCTPKWFSYTYTYIHSFSDSFSI